MAGIFRASGENAIVLVVAPDCEPAAGWVPPDPHAATTARLLTARAARPTRPRKVRVKFTSHLLGL